ncbi:hypothetical protein [Amycolatopsis palatopharyngis]|uniref:hypothetical protein n=1 Tax=Amycolatopsis palatopharyngis TaxID=187982 RepID=UPI000E244A14|nr:hypothetical protein [Amycolatopsis palatopharyngis]
MDTYTYSTEADLPADEFFAALAERPDVARELPWIDIAESEEDDPRAVVVELPDTAPQDGWLRADESGRSLSWGSADEDYRGELKVIDRGPDRCEVAVTVRIELGDGDRARQELEGAVAAIAHTATADIDVEGAQGQKGWA